MMTPVEAVRKVASKIGWNLQDVDLFEINEAFSVQAVAVMCELGIDPARGANDEEVDCHGRCHVNQVPARAHGRRAAASPTSA
jgi:acetyl-CoA C-acetyltransferase